MREVERPRPGPAVISFLPSASAMAWSVLRMAPRPVKATPAKPRLSASWASTALAAQSTTAS